MRAMVFEKYGAAEVLVPADTPIPEVAGRNVLVKVCACGVCRRDILTRRGPGARTVKLPLILGHEVAGTVASVGPEAIGFKVGDRVCSTQRASVCGRCSLCRTGHETLCEELRFLGYNAQGGYAEYVVISDDNLVKLPDNIDMNTGAIIACTVGTTYNAICDTGKVQAGERVIVIGAGGLGAHAVQIARSVGAQVIAVTRSAKKETTLIQLGAHHVVVAPDGQFSRDVRSIFGEGADVAIDTVGGAVFDQTRRSMASMGRIVLVGEVTGTPVEVDLVTLYRRGLQILSAVSTSRRQLERAIQLVSSGAVRPYVHQALPLADAAIAHQLVEGSDFVGRIVLNP